MAAQQWAPMMDTQLWVSDNGRRWASCNGQTLAATSAHLGSPHPSILGNHPCPRWVSNFVHIGNPHLPTLGIQLCPNWKPIYVHVGRPRLSMLRVHTCPQWTAKPTQVGSPILVSGRPRCRQNWMPNPYAWTTKMPPKLDAQSLCMDDQDAAKIGCPILVRGRPKLPKIGSPPRKMDTHNCTWPRDIARTADAHFVDSGSPLSQVATRPVRKRMPNPERG